MSFLKLGQQIIVAVSDGIVRQQRKRINKIDNAPIKKRKKNIEIKDETGNYYKSLKEKCNNYLKQIISKTLKLPIQKIYIDERLEDYGIDSILVVQLTNDLSKDLENINSAMFFEFQTIESIADHLINTQRDNLARMLSKEDKHIESEEDLKEEATNIEYFSGQLQRKRYRLLSKQKAIQYKTQNRIKDIAIIGISGRYPEAKSLD